MAAIDEFDTYIMPDNRVSGGAGGEGDEGELRGSIFQREKNKLVESIEVFAEIQNNPILRRKTFILFLNKVDVFKDKILTSNIIDHFEDFPGRQETTSLLRYSMMLLYRGIPER